MYFPLIFLEPFGIPDLAISSASLANACLQRNNIIAKNMILNGF
jgi:hypothetical protein